MTKPTIIVRAAEGDDHDGHHGGAWKVAYADFMTAMMAFFLLLWLLGAAEEEQLRGLADYFTPSMSEAGGRGQGVLAGQVVAPDGILSGADGEHDLDATPPSDEGLREPTPAVDGAEQGAPPEAPTSAATPEDVPPAASDDPYAWPLGGIADGTDGLDIPEADPGAEGDLADRDTSGEVGPAGAREASIAVAERLAARMEDRPDLAALAEAVRVEVVPEGVYMQIVDGPGRSMFRSGSAAMGAGAQEVVAVVAGVIAETPGAIVLTGHTDSRPFGRGAGYTNWDLSSDRAHAARRALVSGGVAAARIARVEGRADRDPLLEASPEAPENRRIGILLRVVPAPGDAPAFTGR